jgi:hypothetical protein
MQRCANADDADFVEGGQSLLNYKPGLDVGEP